VTARFELRQVYEHPAQAVFELLNDPPFLERKARDFGATDARASRTTAADGTVIVTIDTWEPAHFPPGSKGTSRRTMTLETDLVARRSRWVQIVHGMEDRSSAEGSSEVVELGPSRCALITRGAIEIRVPIMGKVIEKKIVQGVENNADNERRYVAAELDRLAAGSGAPEGPRSRG
jgi:hypothetical protein